ncbi:hypothetical protein NPIL_439831, partial [Nephila pilipes]
GHWVPGLSSLGERGEDRQGSGSGWTRMLERELGSEGEKD